MMALINAVRFKVGADAAYFGIFAILSFLVALGISPDLGFVAMPILTYILASLLYLCFGFLIVIAGALEDTFQPGKDSFFEARMLLLKEDVEKWGANLAAITGFGLLTAAIIYLSLDGQVKASLFSPVGLFFMLISIVQIGYSVYKAQPDEKNQRQKTLASLMEAAFPGIICSAALPVLLALSGLLLGAPGTQTVTAIALGVTYVLLLIAKEIDYRRARLLN